MENNIEKIIEDIKWLLFNDDEHQVRNDCGFTHGLRFVSWCGNGSSFVCKDKEGNEYRITVSKEGN